MAPTAINEQATDSITTLKNSIQVNGGAEQHVIDPEVLTRPNLALWVSKDHK
jgi:L-iditol 2-dehydrogenase